MSFSEREAPITTLYNEFDFLNLQNVIKLEQAKFMWQVINKITPNCIYEVFYPPSNSERVVRNTRIGNKFIPLFRTNIKERFITTVRKVLWSEIPSYLKAKKSLKSFSFNYSKMLK